MIKKEMHNCKVCGKLKSLTAFYSSNSKFYPSGHLDICKPCLKNMVDISDPESLKVVLRQVDKPYIHHIWLSSLRDSPENSLGIYWKIISSLPQYKKLTWADSSFGEDDDSESGYTNPNQPIFVAPVRTEMTIPQIPLEVHPDLYAKWGYGFKPDEVMAFENLYNDLKNNYKLPTASHIEFLKLACISRVKATNAMASGDVKTAKDYMTMFKETTSAGKLQPSQFSKADLSEGLDTFSELVRQVEKTVDIISILPRFKERPQDKVDIVIWANVNYIRRLKGLEEAPYEDIWKFYDDRKIDFESAMLSTGVITGDEDE